MFPILAALVSGPLFAAIGFGVTWAARTALMDMLVGANVQLVVTDPSWALTVDATGSAALGLAAWATALVVWLTGRIGDRGFTMRRFGVGLAAAFVGQLVGLGGAVFHTARAAVPAALGADVSAVTPILDAGELVVGGWAAGGAAAGVIIFAAVTAMAGLGPSTD